MSEAIRLSCSKNVNFPRKVYLFKNKDLIPKAFKNAFCFEDVEWNLAEELLPTLESIAADLNYANIRELLSSYKYTVVPFMTIKQPEGGDYRTVKKNHIQTIGRVWSQHRNLARLFRERADTMKMLIDHKVYSSPCEFCEHFFRHVADQCQLLSRDKASLCHMSLLFGSEVFQKEEPPKNIEEDSIYTITLNDELSPESDEELPA